ncbi:hypothetical protein LCGC14_1804940, partial [marine sediment metagenome]
VSWIKNITREVKVGEVFQGKVTRTLDFGAFVEILPGQEGLIHISKLASYRVNKVTDIVKIGDVVEVKVIFIDEQVAFGPIYTDTIKRMDLQEGDKVLISCQVLIKNPLQNLHLEIQNYNS